MTRWYEKLGVQEFLSHHSGLRLSDFSMESITIAGEFELIAKFEQAEVIQQTFHVQIVIPSKFPHTLPKVFETGGVFPRTPDFHTYQDGSLCLGSEIRLRQICFANPNLDHFFSSIVEPCFYSIAYKLKYKKTPYGELAHGEQGLVDDYECLFGVKGKKAVMQVLKALSMRHRQSNKLSCPCECGNRLGRCSFRLTLLPLRHFANRGWFRRHLADNFTKIVKTNIKQTRKRI
jgi:hypothetical protein